jgi:hypothetical protein
MTLEYGGYKSERTGKIVRRGKERIPGGPGNRRQNRNPEELPDPKTLGSALPSEEYGAEELQKDSDTMGENKDSSAVEDLEVLAEMSRKDEPLSRHLESEEEPPRGGTQYDRLIEEARDPKSTSFWNGRRPPNLTVREETELVEASSLSEGESIQNIVDLKEFSRSKRMEEEHKRESNWSRMWKRWVSRNDDKTKKRGGRG